MNIRAASDKVLILIVFIKSKTKLNHIILPQASSSIQFLNAGFLQSYILSPRTMFLFLTDDDSTLAMIPAIYTFQNNRGCHKRRQMVVFFSLKQISHQERCQSFSVHGKFKAISQKLGLRTHKASHATWKRSSLKTQTLVKMTLPVKCFNVSTLVVVQVSHHIQIITNRAVCDY